MKDWKIRSKEWYKNTEELEIDSWVIEETMKNLELKLCPVCRTSLEKNDNHGNSLPFPQTQTSQKRYGYCPKEDYVIGLASHQYESKFEIGTALSMQVYTNSMFPRLLADSGELAKLKGKHVDLKV